MPEQSIAWQNGDQVAVTFARPYEARPGRRVGDTLPGAVRFGGLTMTTRPEILPVLAGPLPAPRHLPAECG